MKLHKWSYFVVIALSGMLSACGENYVPTPNTAPTVESSLSVIKADYDDKFVISREKLLEKANDKETETRYLQVLNIKNTEGYNIPGIDVDVKSQSITVLPKKFNALKKGESKTFTYSYSINDSRGLSVDTNVSITINGENTRIIDLLFTDSNLQRCIRFETSKHKPELKYPEEIISLNCSSMDIKSLEGLPQLSALTNLDISNNPLIIDKEVNSCGAVLGKTLKKLNLSNTGLSQPNAYPDALKHFTALTELNLSNNNLTAVNLEKQEKLEKLNLSNNSALNGNFLLSENNTVLTELNLSNTGLPNNHPIKNCQSITSLNLNSNAGFSGTRLQDCNSLKNLDLSQNLALPQTFISNLLALPNIHQLTNLNLRQTNLGHTYPSHLDLSKLEHIVDLNLSDNPLLRGNMLLPENKIISLLNLAHTGLTDNSRISTNTNTVTLTSLNIGNNNLSSINLANVQGLTELNLSKNQFTTSFLSTLAGYPLQQSLTKLNIGENKQVDDAFLVALANTSFQNTLKQLNLYCTAIKNNNQELNQFSALDVLDLSDTSINDLDVTKLPARLKSLTLNATQITNLNLGHLNSLTEFTAKANTKLVTVDIEKNIHLQRLILTENKQLKTILFDPLKSLLLSHIDIDLETLDDETNKRLASVFLLRHLLNKSIN